jgi:hypothetical protein
MKYAVEIGSGAMIYIVSFRNIDAGIQKLIGGETETHRQQCDLISLLLYFFIYERGLKMGYILTRYARDNIKPVTLIQIKTNHE